MEPTSGNTFANGLEGDDRCRKKSISMPETQEQLPVILKHAATARESEIARHERLRGLGGGDMSRAARLVRIRHAPPPTGACKVSSSVIEFPRLKASSQREADSAEKVRALQAMEAELEIKQAETATFFKTLNDLQQRSVSGSMKALLQQISNLLIRATYQLATSGEGDLSSPDVDPSAIEELAGHEFFSLYSHAQQSLEVEDLKKHQLETKLEMERSLETELVGVLQQLERDLHAIRWQHLENHERVEAERTAVMELEEQHAGLVAQELRLQKECDGLEQQANRQRTQLSDLQSKSAYLDFISRIPLKRHLEQKKVKEQEEALRAVVEQEEEENRKLEQELAKLDEQLLALGDQLERDVAHRAMLQVQLNEAENVRDVTHMDCQRLRDSHTPRPAWDAIIEKIPELSNNDDIEWDELQAAMGNTAVLMLQRADAAARNERRTARRESNNQVDGEDSGESSYDDNEDDGEVGGQTQELVKEILQWIERLQKHCGVNLHLSRIWHDVEEARVELNILQHQLEQALRKRNRYTSKIHRHTNDQNASTTATQRPKQEYICALGVHSEIPLFLRHQGKVKRHPLKKGELEALIRKVWTEKRQREKRNPHLRLPLEEVLYEKLHRKYGFQPLIAEWGYNILLSLDAFAWDPEIELFLLCLTNAVSDCVYLDQEMAIDKCGSMLVKLSETYGIDSFIAERRVLLKDALVALRKLFPLKTSVQLQALEKAIIRDMHKMKRGGNDSILYIDDILPRAVQYPRGFFVKAIRSQHFKEIQEYYSALTAELESRDEHKTGQLPLHQVREAMLGIDPLADSNAVWNALMRGVGVKTRAQLEMHEVYPYKPLLRQMNTTGLLKFALNFDPSAELNLQRKGTIDLSVLSGAGRSRKSLVVGSRPGSQEHLVSLG